MSTSTHETRPPVAEPVRIPVTRYVSEDFAARERQKLWPNAWQLACSLDHVAAPGDWYEHTVGALSVLIVRTSAGDLRAYQNVCRHRGAELCKGTGPGLTELRCPFHGWTWNLDGTLREVPSRRAFGVDNDDFALFPARVDVWGPLVFVCLALDGPELREFLDPIPQDAAWARVDEFRCTSRVTVRAQCNWKTLIEGFSETYHVQGIHREMLAMCDDVRGPQEIWGWHGKLQQSYGVASPRTRGVDDAQVWASFVEIMGTRIGLAQDANPGPAPDLAEGTTLRAAIAQRLRDHAASEGHDYTDFDDAQALDMSQYNLFPNVSVLVFSDMLTAVRSRPGSTPDEAFMDVFQCRRAVDPSASGARPFDVDLPAGAESSMGLVVSQDIANFARAQRGLHQPALTHLAVSPTEECRVVNLHRNLERVLDIAPSELIGLDGFLRAFPGLLESSAR